LYLFGACYTIDEKCQHLHNFSTEYCKDEFYFGNCKNNRCGYKHVWTSYASDYYEYALKQGFIEFSDHTT
jgi:hypothetical protein